MWAFIAHVFGLDDMASRWYAFWSGVGGDLSSFAIFGGLYALIRKHNCDVHGCWRLGVLPTQVGDVVHHVCKRHHPGAPTASDVRQGEYARTSSSPATEGGGDPA